MLRLMEHYPSIQGEGPRVGVPTQFVRFAGCNLRCPGWPCDTPFAIYPEIFTGQQERKTVDDIVRAAIEMREETAAKNICLTGGEPMLQRNDEIVQLVDLLTQNGFSVEMFSNGTIPYPVELLKKCSVVMDWKLKGSGEDRSDTRVLNLEHMFDYAAPDRHAFKFTVKDEDDLKQMQEIIKHEWLDESRPGVDTPWIFCGRVWNSELTDAELVAYILEHKLPVRLNVQLHQHIWSPDERGR